MAYGSYLHLLMKILEAIDLDVLEVIDGLASGEGTGQGRVVGHLARDSLAADRARLADRLLALGGVDDQVDLVVLDHIDDVRSALRSEERRVGEERGAR